MKNFLAILPLVFVIMLACKEDYYPKPKGFLRIDLPVKSYAEFDTSFPYSFEYPAYAQLDFRNQVEGEKYWMNIDFPTFKGVIHFSYKPVNDNLQAYINDAHTLVSKLIPNADNISHRAYVDEENRIFGLVYEIDGAGAASPCQFYVTDSSKHFLRGALYFNVRPNNDSLAPVIEFLKEDIDHLIESLLWKE